MITCRAISVILRVSRHSADAKLYKMLGAFSEQRHKVCDREANAYGA